MQVMDSFSLRGKTAVLTGGAGLYGANIARGLYEAGARVYIASTNLPKLEAAAEAMRAEGGDVEALRLDLEDPKNIEAFCTEVYGRAGAVDILVNNAVARTMKNYNDDVETFEKSMQINCTGLFVISRAFGNRMAERGSGSIINIASIQGVVGTDRTLYTGLGMDGFIPDYFLHKGGMIEYTRFLASYYGPSGVRCNAISPGGFLNNQPEEFIRRYSDRTMLGRLAVGDDIKGAVVFFASDASLYVTGTNLMVDGGYVAV